MKPQDKSVAFQTFGCRLNQSETAVLAGCFQDEGWQVLEDARLASVVVVNTCTLTSVSDSKCRSAIRKVHRENPEAKIAVIGCYAESDSESLKSIEGVEWVEGNERKFLLPRLIADDSRALQAPARGSDGGFEMPTPGQLSSRVRASLKVQDGCDCFCSYCIVPYVRGAPSSRKMDNLLDEARALRKAGVRELVLTGINLGLYADGGRSLEDVCDELNDLEFDRLRLSSIELSTLTDGLLYRMANRSHALVPFLHLPLQSGSAEVLKGMRRPYLPEDWARCVNEARDRVPDLCVGTDVLTGTPWETERCFEETKNFLRDTGPDYLHVFTYSERPGTPAAELPQVPVSERKRRTRELIDLGENLRNKLLKNQIGKEKPVLFEELKNGLWKGKTDNYISVSVCTDMNLENIIIPVKIEGIEKDSLIGNI